MQGQWRSLSPCSSDTIIWVGTGSPVLCLRQAVLYIAKVEVLNGGMLLQHFRLIHLLETAVNLGPIGYCCSDTIRF